MSRDAFVNFTSSTNLTSGVAGQGGSGGPDPLASDGSGGGGEERGGRDLDPSWWPKPSYAAEFNCDTKQKSKTMKIANLKK